MVYIVTNRRVLEKNGKEYWFGTRDNDKAIDELRVAKATRKNNGWGLEIPPDVTDAEGNHPSWHYFSELQQTMYAKKRNCVFFVHGYNTNLTDALEMAQKIQDTYKVEVILFTWPSVGGGEDDQVTMIEGGWGTLNYKRDKRVAMNSASALDRILCFFDHYMKRHLKENPDIAEKCESKITLLCHSMGNYLLKKYMASSTFCNRTLLFDNVVLAAADTNNMDHEIWVDAIPHRRRIYILLNESDYALATSRAKTGGEQLARLGHYTRNLISKVAIYLDFTETPSVGRAHNYLVGDAVRKASHKKILKQILNGQRGERDLPEFDPTWNIYMVR